MGALAILCFRSCWYLVGPLQKPCALPQATKVITQKCRLYSESPGGMGEKARSTAEEFNRQAAEKAESTSKAAKKAWDDFTDAVTGNSDQTKSEERAKEKYKEKVEKGNYDKTGQE